MRIISLIKTLILIVCSVGLFSCTKPQVKERPNILYIFTDDQSFRTVSAYPESYEWASTPNIDKLAEEGMLFTSGYTGTWCMPSRATALTGLLPHGINSLRISGRYPQSEYDPDSLRFWPSVFRESGYYTGIIGKWHTGSDDGAGRDWDYSAVWNHTVSEYGGYFRNQKISFNGATPVSVKGYSTDNYTEYALDFIENRSDTSNQPWYLWLCYDGVHAPYTPAERHKDAYNDASPVPVPSDIYPPRPGKPSHMVNYGVWEKGLDGDPEFRGVGYDEFLHKYNAGVLAIDEGVGQIVETLKRTGQLDNTLIVFTSDQGFAIGQHGFTWKYAPYDATLKAPLIIRWTEKIQPGQVCEHPVGGQDLIPTFFSIAEIDLPWKMHGYDITPMFDDPRGEWNHPLFMENTARLYGEDTNIEEFPINGGIPSWISLREGKYKYVRYLIEDEIEELYDLSIDKEELTNLALLPEYEELLKDFREKMINELERTDTKYIDNLPALKIN